MNRIDQSTTQLRHKAEAELAHIPKPMTKQIPPSAEKLLHELQVHQIELEMQNEELRRTQAELETSRDRYLDFYDFAPVGYITLNKDGMIDEINLAGASLLGVTRNKLPYHRFAFFVAPEDRDRWHHHFQNALTYDDILTCELPLLRSDGSSFYARLDCMRQNKAGKITGMRVMLADITESKKAEQRHKVVIDTAIDGFWMADTEGNLLEANAAYAKMSGYSVEELQGMHISQLEAKERSREEIKAHITKVIAQGHDRFETRHRHRDGHEIDIEVSVTYMPESRQIFGFCRDITERKKAEDALREALGDRSSPSPTPL